jgi:tartrate dehydrogenase/decarboxylase/D-malate dehydrogenase
MKEYNIAAIPGDGIGKEVIPEGLKVLKEAALKHQFKINFTEYDFASCDYYEKHGKMLPDDWKEKLSKHNAIFFWCSWYA